MRGFTTIRDLGGPSFGLKTAIDAGVVSGPRIFPSGAFISQTFGHGDFRMLAELPRDPGAALRYTERMRSSAIADRVDQILLRTREQLMQGASQIKLMAGGGVASNYDSLDVAQYSEDEIHAPWSSGGLGNIPDSPRLHATRHCGWREMYRPWPARRRSDG
jgi:imidazolonepropionase-like amidohydrolase